MAGFNNKNNLDVNILKVLKIKQFGCQYLTPGVLLRLENLIILNKSIKTFSGGSN
jgi:hypothetical protein